MNSFLSKLSFASLLTMALVGCGGVPEDDTKLNELDDTEQVALCEDVCADAVSYDLTCMEDGSEVSLKSSFGDDDATCATGCEAMLAQVKDSCALSAGDLRSAYTVKPTCENADQSFGVIIGLVTCTQ